MIENIKNEDFSLGKILLKYAVMAPSCLNIQPWRFELRDGFIKIIVDKSRWRKIADHDQRELYISAGCVLENLLIAAEHFGYDYQVFYGGDDPAAIVKLDTGGKPSSFRGPDLFDAIPKRHTNRKIYANKILSSEDLNRLQEACIEERLTLHLATHDEAKTKACDLIKRVYAIQLSNTAFRKELGYWMGQGLFMDSWTKAKIAQMAAMNINIGRSQANKFSELTRSSAAIGIIGSENNDRCAQIEAGQVLERVWLQATALGIGLHPVSQIMELPELMEETAKLLPNPDAHPQITFGLGYTDHKAKCLSRRPLGEFFIADAR
jgi:nitroreductase